MQPKLIKRIYRDLAGNDTTFTFDYDDEGKKLRVVSHSKQNQNITQADYNYDKRGNVIKIMHSEVSSTGKTSLEHTNLMEYDSEGRNIHDYSVAADGLIYFELRHQYDDGGRRIATRHMGEDGGVNFITTYQYDDAGCLITSISESQDGRFVSRHESELDDKGQEIRTTERDSLGRVIGVEEREYDAQGSPVRVTSRDAAGAVVNRRTWENTYQ